MQTAIDAKVGGSIYSAESFQVVLKKERSRADREGKHFSMVVFTALEEKSRELSKTDVIGRIQERMRAIDQIGRIGSNRFAVLLPYTGRDGADKFVRDVRAEVNSRGPSLVCEVFAYPDSSCESEGQSSSGSRDMRDRSYSLSTGELQSLFTYRIPTWKRVLDIAGSIVGLMLFAPIFLLLTIYIKLVSPGPALFKQERVGYKGRMFTFLKFRTMHVNNDVNPHKDYLKTLISSPDTPMEKLDDKSENRSGYIPGARILRKMALDELPQFINVLTGSMSLVGPRPCIPYEAKEFLRWHRHRFDLMPGITGLWQVSGKNRLTFKEMIRLDIAYGKRVSFWFDVKILLVTLPALLGYSIEAALKRLKRLKRKGGERQADGNQ